MIEFLSVFGIITFFVISIEKMFFTLEVNYINVGNYFKTFIFGFIGIFIWISYTAHILTDANIYNTIAFLSANVLGTLFGVYVNNLINKDVVTLRAFVNIDNKSILEHLKEYNTALIKCSGLKKEYYIILLTIPKKELTSIISLIKQYEKESFIVVNKSKYTRLNHM